MILVYHDVGGTHSTCLAANIHINQLPVDRIPTKREILSLKTFDKLEKKDYGHLIYIGQDEYGVDVFTVSRQQQPQLVLNGIRDMYEICNKTLDGLYIVGTIQTVNNWMRIGGFSSRRLHLVNFGRPLVTYGSLKAYPNIVKLVKNTKEKIAFDLRQ
ncbi:DUF3189 family protein [Garciella nitratireducens]|uniref:DUF3189 family protein n=1 Tax=Garciella nitratireducens DSM 15102 TaxID=1121911 RepID=A0A1T4KKT3_9FIRM|nr:DUF3189 family protein [Garciella nitratireducens]RBP41599.1 uncharacterized protein DUF3189 [Garciella nitratireducens]SJZ42998.1 Protein of unknown function [Garciella nitratireducens DSM 15102]